MSTAENKQRVRSMFAALDAGNRAGFWDELAEDVTFTAMGTTPWSGTYAGKEGIQRALLKPLYEALGGKGPRLTVQRVLADEDVVIVVAQGDSVTKSGARYDNQYCLLFQLAEGKVRQIVEYSDTDLIARVLGPRLPT